jgi:hypothetical protein
LTTIAVPFRERINLSAPWNKSPATRLTTFGFASTTARPGLISANRLRRHVRCFIIQPVFILVFIAVPADVKMLDPLRCQLLMLE